MYFIFTLGVFSVGTLDKMIPVLVIWFFCITKLLRLYICFDIDFMNLRLKMK